MLVFDHVTEKIAFKIFRGYFSQKKFTPEMLSLVEKN